MARQIRKKSGTGIYHIMLRGINRQDIFENAVHYTAKPNISRTWGVKPAELTASQILQADSTDYLLGGSLTMKNGKIDKYLFEGGYAQASAADFQPGMSRDCPLTSPGSNRCLRRMFGNTTVWYQTLYERLSYSRYHHLAFLQKAFQIGYRRKIKVVKILYF